MLAVCRYFSYIVSDQGEFSYPIENRFLEGLTTWGLDESLNSDSVIVYKNKHYSLEAKYRFFEGVEHDDEGNQISFREQLFLPTLTDLSTEFINLLDELNKIKPKSATGLHDFSSLFWTIPTSFFKNDVAAVLDNPFYLPTERGLQSIFSLGKSSIPNISDSLFNQLARLDQISRTFNKETVIDPLSITFINETGRAYVKKIGENRSHSLSKGASGYQSGIPIVLVIKYYNDIRKKAKTLLIEEPELNLFPSTQKLLVNYLVESSVKFGHTILLTTHSPYVLTSINNLMYAYEVGQKDEDGVSKIIPKKNWVNPSDVSVYRLLADGTCKKIIEKTEDGTLIDASEIDGISRELNSEFDELIRLDMENTDMK